MVCWLVEPNHTMKLVYLYFNTAFTLLINIPKSWASSNGKIYLIKSTLRFKGSFLKDISLACDKTRLHAFLISNTFISNARLKFTKKHLKAKQQPEVEILLFENYRLSSSRHHPKIIWNILKNAQKSSTSV